MIDLNPRIGFFAGSFDPVTLGHLDILQRVAQLFDKVVVGIGMSADKSGLFAAGERLSLLNHAVANFSNVEVVTYTDLTVNACAKAKAGFLVRGVRGSADLEYETRMIDMNRKLNPAIETILLPTNPTFSHVSSSLARDIAKHQGDLSSLVSEEVAEALRAKFS